jgi:hypothetical protein
MYLGLSQPEDVPPDVLDWLWPAPVTAEGVEAEGPADGFALGLAPWLEAPSEARPRAECAVLFGDPPT